MDYKFLHKVLDQIVRETEIDYSMEEIQFPFSSHSSSLLFVPFLSFYSSPFSFLSLFLSHCKEIYGLNREETEYVWGEYVISLSNKIKNNG